MRHNSLLSFNHSRKVRQPIGHILWSGSLSPVAHGAHKSAEIERIKVETRILIWGPEDVHFGKRERTTWHHLIQASELRKEDTDVYFVVEAGNLNAASWLCVCCG